MDGDERRKEIIKMLMNTSEPLSGRKLGEILKVSRQVIVQDVALIRAQGLDIIATARGYILYRDTDRNKQRIMLVQHNFNGMGVEGSTVSDLGGVSRKVMGEHPIYGEMIGNMMIKTKRDAEQFIRDIQREDTYPLMKLTNGIHMHTIEASSEKILDEIETELNQKGYLYTGP